LAAQRPVYFFVALSNLEYYSPWMGLVHRLTYFRVKDRVKCLAQGYLETVWVMVRFELMPFWLPVPHPDRYSSILIKVAHPAAEVHMYIV
jgi:hypothetical protein